jgi:hypothetical protein
MAIWAGSEGGGTCDRGSCSKVVSADGTEDCRCNGLIKEPECRSNECPKYNMHRYSDEEIST